jgi:hypothetical protein
MMTNCSFQQLKEMKMEFSAQHKHTLENQFEWQRKRHQESAFYVDGHSRLAIYVWQ